MREYLRGDVMASTTGRTRFLARVAGNSLDIALRDLTLGPPARAAEQRGLEALLGVGGPIPELRRRLCERIRNDESALDDAALHAHLRRTVVNQIAIDQPRYSGLANALAE